MMSQPGPTPTAERALGPDLARGAMLLLIALANVTLYLYGRPYGPGGSPLTGGTGDQAWTAIRVLLVDGRAYPLFAALFGYGMVQFLARRDVSLLRRRNVLLLGFGLAHGVLLFSGDVLGTYGLVGLILTFAMAAPSRDLLWGAAAALVPFVLLTALGGYGSGLDHDPTERPDYGSLAADDALPALGLRMAEWPAVTVTMAILVFTPMLVGIVAARRRLLDDPERHRRTLAGVAVVGLTIAVLGGLPLALAASEVQDPGSIGAGFTAFAVSAHLTSGLAGGFGYAAAIGLVAGAIRRRPDRLVPIVAWPAGAVAALGARSLTFYLLQSVIFVTVFTPVGFGLGGSVGTLGSAGIAAACWLLSVLAAAGLAGAGRRGPAESLLRWLTYRPRRLRRPVGRR